MVSEVFFNHDDVIVSKTDLKGKITYVNDVFCTISGFEEDELIGNPHSIIRHEKMPRCVFKLLWDKIQQGEEVFAYVINKCKNDDYYWVLAHVTPSFDSGGSIVAYHSNRRVPDPNIIKEKIIPLYEELVCIETSTANAKDGMIKSYQRILDILSENHMDYDEFIFSLINTSQH